MTNATTGSRGACSRVLSPIAVTRFVVLLIAALLIPAPAARAQCGPQWLPGGGVPGIAWNVSDTTIWDPDGPGPRAPMLVVGGSFTVAGNVSANHIATYDPA